MERLRSICQRIDGRGYRAYGDLAGAYRFDLGTLHVDHVQGDPFAAPSRVRVVVPWERAGLPEHARDGAVRRVAAADYLARGVAAALREPRRREPRRGSGGSGKIEICPMGQEVLLRSSVEVLDDAVVARLAVGLPAAGRRVLGREAWRLLGERLPSIVRRTLVADALPLDALRVHCDTVEDARALRDQLADRGWVAFVADGALLPRRAGNDDRPMAAAEAVAWSSPEALAATVELPHAGTVRGTAIPAGVTLITGGGYHGKSTLLQALLRGVYDHVPGDGRERVVTAAGAVAIRAEDGRRVEGVDLRPFIGALPAPEGRPARSTAAFRSEDASGSTSQAAAIVEALEVGATALLVDEDTSATNFMVRDRRMQELIAGDREPITPFIARVRELYERHGVSSILVIGGVGDYLDVADTVLMMDAYRPRDATERARALVARTPVDLRALVPSPSAHLPPAPRTVDRRSLDPRRGRRDKVRARGTRTIQFGREDIELGAVEQVVDPAQARAIGDALLAIARGLESPDDSVRALVTTVDELVRERGLGAVDGFRGGAGDRAWARPFEIAAALDRLRSLRVRQ